MSSLNKEQRSSNFRAQRRLVSLFNVMEVCFAIFTTRSKIVDIRAITLPFKWPQVNVKKHLLVLTSMFSVDCISVMFGKGRCLTVSLCENVILAEAGCRRITDS